MDKRECLRTGLKQAYATINSLNATSRKISAAKAILLMKRDQVRHEMDRLTKRLNAMIAIMHSKLEMEIGTIISSKTEYLESWEHHVLETICKIGEVCVQTEHALKLENEQMVEGNGHKLMRQLDLLCQAGLDADTVSDFENSVRIEFVPGVLEEILEYSTLGNLLTSTVDDFRSIDVFHQSDVVHKETVLHTQTSEKSDCNKTNENRFTKNQKSADNNAPLKIISNIPESSISPSVKTSEQENKIGQFVGTKYVDNRQGCQFNRMSDNNCSKLQESTSSQNGDKNLSVIIHKDGSGDENLLYGEHAAIRELPNPNFFRMHNDVMISRPTLNSHNSICTKGRGRGIYNCMELASRISSQASSNLDHSQECKTLEKQSSNPSHVDTVPSSNSYHPKIPREPRNKEAQTDKQANMAVSDFLSARNKSSNNIDDSRWSRNSHNSTSENSPMLHGTALTDSQDKALQHIVSSNTHDKPCLKDSAKVTKLPMSNRKKIPSDGLKSSVTECWDDEGIQVKQEKHEDSSLDCDVNSQNLDHQSSADKQVSQQKEHLKLDTKDSEYKVIGDTKESESDGQHKTGLSVPFSPSKESTNKSNGEAKKSIISGTIKSVLRKHIKSNKAQSSQQVEDLNNNNVIKPQVLDDTGSKTSADSTVAKSFSSKTNSCKSPMKKKPDLLMVVSPITKQVPVRVVNPVLPIKTKQLGIDFSQMAGFESAKQVAMLGSPKTGNKSLFQFPIGITRNEHEEVIVCDSGAGKVRVFKYNCQLFSISNGKEGEKLTHPSAVVVNDKCDIFVKDDNAIHVFDRSGNALKCIGKKILKRPYGLAMTTDGKLVVLDADKRCPTLYLFNQDGTVASSPPFSPLTKANSRSKCRFLALYEDKVLVSDLGLSRMYLVNLEGVLISTFGTFGRGPGSFVEPSGVTVDSVGNWIVADSKNDRLQIFKPDGTFLSQLKLSSPINRPSDIHLTADGHLYVVNFLNHVVIIYKIHQ